MSRTKRTIREFAADHDPAMLPEPVETGSPTRPADNTQQGEPSVMFTPGSEQGVQNAAMASRSQMIAAVVDKMLNMKGDALAQLFNRMYDEGGNTISGLVGDNAANLASVKGNPKMQEPAMDPSMKGSPGMQVAMNMQGAAGDTTAKPGVSLPAADPAGLAKEEVEELLSGETLTEEAKIRIAVLFESAVNTKINLITAELEEQFAEELEEAVEDAIEIMVESVDQYASATAKQFIRENAVPLVDTARLYIAENFMMKFRNLLEDSYIQVASTEDAVVRLSEEKAVSEKVALEEMVNNNVLKEDINFLMKELVVEKACYGLSIPQRSELKQLAETVAFATPEDYANKIKVLKETKVTAVRRTKSDPTFVREALIAESTNAPRNNSNSTIAKLAQLI